MKYTSFVVFVLTMTNCCFCSETIITSLGIQSVISSYMVKKLNENGDKWYKSQQYEETILKVIPKIISDICLKKNLLFFDDALLTNQSHYNYVFLCEMFKNKIDNKDKPLEDLLDIVYEKLSVKCDNKNYFDKARRDIRVYLTDLAIDKLLEENLLEKDSYSCFFSKRSKHQKKSKKNKLKQQIKINDYNKYLENTYMSMLFDRVKNKIIKMELGYHEYTVDYELSEDMCLYDVIKDYNPKHNILKIQELGVRTYLNASDRKVTTKNQSFDSEGNVTVTYRWDKDAKNDYVEFTSDGYYDISGITLTELGKNFTKKITIVIEGDTYGHETMIAPKFLQKLQSCYDDAIKTDTKINLIFKKKNNRNVLIFHNADSYISSGYGIFRGMASLTEIDFSGAIFVCYWITGKSYRNVLFNSYMFFACNNLRKIIWNKDVKTSLMSAHYLFGGTSLEELDLSSFYAADSLESVDSICSWCNKLKKVNISSLTNYDKNRDPVIRSAKRAFIGCTELEDVELCDLTGCTEYDQMFDRCPKDVKLDKTKLPKNFELELKDND